MNAREVFICPDCRSDHPSLYLAQWCCNEPDQVYRCVNCDQIHEYEDDALTCCCPESDISKRYQCRVCNRLHDDENAAEQCCQEGHDE